MNVEASLAPQGSVPDSVQDMEVLAAETESLLPYKQVIVKALIAVAAEEKQEGAALEELLLEIPEPLWPAVRRRYFYEIGVIAEKKKERAAYRPSGIVITGVLFDLAAAILLMATGTYEMIHDFLRDRLELQTQIKEMGATMLRHGVTPDMKMVEKLQRIILQAQQKERELLEEQQQKHESA
jgi:hypothetical protein